MACTAKSASQFARMGSLTTRVEQVSGLPLKRSPTKRRIFGAYGAQLVAGRHTQWIKTSNGKSFKFLLDNGVTGAIPELRGCQVLWKES